MIIFLLPFPQVTISVVISTILLTLRSSQSSEQRAAAGGGSSTSAPGVFSSLSIIYYSFPDDSAVIIKIQPREVHFRQQVHHIRFVVIGFGFGIIVGVSTAAEDVVMKGGSLEMVSMELISLEVEVMGKKDQVK